VALIFVKFRGSPQQITVNSAQIGVVSSQLKENQLCYSKYSVSSYCYYLLVLTVN